MRFHKEITPAVQHSEVSSEYFMLCLRHLHLHVCSMILAHLIFVKLLVLPIYLYFPFILLCYHIIFLLTSICVLLLLLFSPTGATVVCGVCSVLWILSRPGVLFPALFCGCSESGPACGWWNGSQPRLGGGLQGASWWQLYTQHPSQVRMHGFHYNSYQTKWNLVEICFIFPLIRRVNKPDWR